MANPIEEVAMVRIKFSIIAFILAIVFLNASLVGATDYKYVGTKRSNKYHYSSCRWAKKIKADNLRTFNSSKEAQAAGYVPCKVCRPPGKD